MSIYFGFAIADGMFPEHCQVTRNLIHAEVIQEISDMMIPVLNPYHTATVNAMKSRFHINVDIPEAPPKVTLQPGDKMIVMSVRGLPRLTEAREYTDEEIASAEFAFGVWTVNEA